MMKKCGVEYHIIYICKTKSYIVDEKILSGTKKKNLKL